MKQQAYLATIPDSVKMTRDEFIQLLTRFKYHRNVRFGFSMKHTADIMEYRKLTGAKSTVPGNMYNVPVVYDTEVTYVM